jgi:hypothetical protein
MAINHESFVNDNLVALGIENPTICWDPDKRVGTFFLTLNPEIIERLYVSTQKGASMYHPVQRKEKTGAQRERYVRAMNNGWWEDYASSIAFVVYPDESQSLQFRLADGYQRTASSKKAKPLRPLKFVGVVHVCDSQEESGSLIRHYNLGQTKTVGDNIRGANAFAYVHPEFAKIAQGTATRVRYWNANQTGQILPDEWEQLSSELEMPLKALEKMIYMVRLDEVEGFESAALDAGLASKQTHTVFARLVGLLYQARDTLKARKFCELVLKNEIEAVEPRLLAGESLNSISKTVLDAYALYCDPSFQPDESASKKDWSWSVYIPPVGEWPVFKYHGLQTA